MCFGQRHCGNDAASIESALKKPASNLAANISGRVFVSDLVETKNVEYSSEMGQTLSNCLSNLLVNQMGRKYQVLARREVIEIMKDSAIFGDDPGTIERLSKETQMDILISGSYGTVGNEVLVTIKAVSAKNGQVVASSSCKFEKTPDIEKMMAHRYKRSSNPDETHSEISGALRTCWNWRRVFFMKEVTVNFTRCVKAWCLHQKTITRSM